MKSFSFDKLDSLNLEKAKQYITKYFVPLKNGDHAVYIDDDYTIMTQNDVKKTYFDRMSSELNQWYFKKYNSLRSIVYELNEERFFDDKLNLCPAMLHEVKSYSSFDCKIKERVEIMMNYIFEILSNKNEKFNIYITKWISNLLKGNKNDSCLYFRGEQGIGKSTLFTFIRKYVIGEKLYLETGSEPIKSKFNKVLGGKLLVCFEELETFSINEWVVVSSRLKRYITSDTIEIEPKGKDSYTSNNINNYVIISNNDAIKDDDGRRYFISDIATHRKGDKKFWSNIYDNCFDEEVGHAFYCRMLEIDTSSFNPQHDMPLTQSKLDSFAKRLDVVEQYLKNEYILKQKGIKCSVEELYSEYKFYCSSNSHKQQGKIVFGRKLEELGIKYFKSNSVNKYKVEAEVLKKIADERHWIHDIDDFTTNKDEDEDDTPFSFDADGIDFGLEPPTNKIDYKLIKENEDLKLKIDELQKQLALLTVKQVPVQVPVPVPAPAKKKDNIFLQMLDIAEKEELKNEKDNSILKKLKN